MDQFQYQVSRETAVTLAESARDALCKLVGVLSTPENREAGKHLIEVSLALSAIERLLWGLKPKE